MLIEVVKAKLHTLRVTDTKLRYEGSISLDPVLVEAAGMLISQKVQVVNLNNGVRLDTYIIEGERGSGECCLNGPAARLAMVNDEVIVIAYGICDEKEAVGFKPKIVLVDSAKNRIKNNGSRKINRRINKS